MVVHDAAARINVQLITEERRKAQLSHKWLSELIKCVGQNNKLTLLPKPREELHRPVQWPHLGNHILNVADFNACRSSISNRCLMSLS